jgi:hypothetical protein
MKLTFVQYMHHERNLEVALHFSWLVDQVWQGIANRIGKFCLRQHLHGHDNQHFTVVQSPGLTYMSALRIHSHLPKVMKLTRHLEQ